MSDIGHEEGYTCGRDGCEGVIEMQKPDNCSCHLSAPCYACTSVRLCCLACGWVEDDPIDSLPPVQPAAAKGAFDIWTPRPLDPTRIDWRDKPHSSCSMIKEGVYPEGTTREEVRKVVNGTFGGRFEHFGGGRFKFIAYTD